METKKVIVGVIIGIFLIGGCFFAYNQYKHLTSIKKIEAETQKAREQNQKNAEQWRKIKERGNPLTNDKKR